MLAVAEKAFRKLKHHKLMKGLYEGSQYLDGLHVKTKIAA